MSLLIKWRSVRLARACGRVCMGETRNTYSPESEGNIGGNIKIEVTWLRAGLEQEVFIFGF
jgi:hypothetical protein